MQQSKHTTHYSFQPYNQNAIEIHGTSVHTE